MCKDESLGWKSTRYNKNTKEALNLNSFGKLQAKLASQLMNATHLV